MFRHTLPFFIRWIYPQMRWKVKTKQQAVYLTFDDGPHPQITPQILDILDAYQAKATFFCVGENASKYPNTMLEIIARGHRIGNHTHNHLNGWKTADDTYIQNVSACEPYLKTTLFRPPYGRITYRQISKLSPHYTLVMWTILTRDYEPHLPLKQAINTCCNAMQRGSIIVLHDSVKAQKNVFPMLQALLDYGTRKQYQFLALPENF
jgi:peptidoglycan/xylan/chitin deacetylase (PgdA/CDA1 family)